MTKQNKKGFTIIEVVLVLAIGGLIFLMVFIALPALQSSQRNTQREDDMSRVITAVTEFQTNNSGQTPFEDGHVADNFIVRYIDDEAVVDASGEVTDCSDQFKDPDGNCYQIKVTGKASDGEENKAMSSLPADLDHIFYVMNNAGCGDTEGTYTYDSGSRKFAMFFVQEGGAIACNDNH